MRRGFHLLSLVAGSLAACPPALGQTVIIADGTFDPADWTVFSVESVAGPTETAAQAGSGGNPGSFRQMQHTLPPVEPEILAEIEVSHLYLGPSYDPEVQGAIDHIDYSEDLKMLALSWPQAHAISQLLIVQNNRGFLSHDFLGVVGTTEWESQSLVNLEANDFSAADGTGDQPDFSESGGVLQFGYVRSNTRTETLPPIPPDQDLVYDHGIDNFTVTIFQEGEVQPNQAPVARNDLAVVVRSITKRVDVLQNDSDPDGDLLSIADYTLPLHGQLFRTAGVFSYTFSSGGGVDAFAYTISDGELTDNADVLLLVDCGFCSTACAAAAYAKTSAPRSQEIDLELIRRFRDESLNATEAGSTFVDIYYERTPEIAWILIVDRPELGAQAKRMIEVLQPAIRNHVESDGSALISQAQMDSVSAFLNALKEAGSDSLRSLVESELERLGPFDDFVGMPVRDVLRSLFGEPVGTDVTTEAPSSSAGPILHPNFPNPFKTRTEIRYSLTVPANVALDVFDVSGRRVTALERGRRASGIHSVLWHGRDETGRRLANGTYVIRLRADRLEKSRLVVLTR